MGKNIVVTLTFGDVTFPAGTVIDHITVTVQSADGSRGKAPQNLPLGTLTAPFDDVDAGDWVATAQAIDPAGQPVGALASTPFTVPPDTVRLAVPISVSVAIN